MQTDEPLTPGHALPTPAADHSRPRRLTVAALLMAHAATLLTVPALFQAIDGGMPAYAGWPVGVPGWLFGAGSVLGIVAILALSPVSLVREAKRRSDAGRWVAGAALLAAAVWSAVWLTELWALMSNSL